MKKTNKKGFTLIELLVVIAIIAILSVVVILTLNPAELLKQARDSNRVSDLSTLKSAISLYLSDVSSPNIAQSSTVATNFGCTSGGTCYNYCYESTIAGNGTTTSRCGVFNNMSGTSNVSSSASTYQRNVDGNGWVPVNFTSISSGAPVGNLPVDPVNNVSYYYAYAASSTLTFEIDAFMESAKYTTGANGVIANDGGNNSSTYEVGTASNLAL